MIPLWRSLQYVPAHIEKYLKSERIAAADALILDLQDSVPAGTKDQARAMAAAAIPVLSGKGQDILVRINVGALGYEDIQAVVAPGLAALVVPHVRSADDIRTIDQQLSEIEAGQGLPVGGVRLLVLIECALGVTRMVEIAQASPRIIAMNLGNEDLAHDLGVGPTEAALALPRQMLVIAAVAAGVTPLGLLGSGSGFGDLDAYRQLAERSRAVGFRGSSCIHPSQIAILNAVFSPTEEECDWAERILAASADVDVDRGAFALDGQMIDAPILARASNIINLLKKQKLRNHLKL